MRERIERLAGVLRDEGIDAYLAWSPDSLSYLADYHEHGGRRLLVVGISPQGQDWIVCPSMSVGPAQRAGFSRIDAWNDGEDPIPLVMGMAEAWSLRSGIVAVDDEMPAHILLRLQEALPAALFRTGGRLLARLTAIKEPREIDLLREAGRRTDEVFEEVQPQIRAGMTERQIERLLVDGMARRGLTPYFAIIASGPNGADPHHLTGERTLQRGDVVVVDFGGDLEGYKSDITRMVCIGEPTEEQARVHDTVYRAHMAAREAIRPGVTGEQVDAAARKVIEDAGYGEYFVHRTGHGIGMRGQEDPFIVAGNDEPLEVTNCFSIEPGIYLPGRFGVRIENIVTVTQDGHESLNADPSPTLVVCDA